ncbi:hypothetical protein [Parvibium lacunae]|uniref:Uncharacterized protein n=1 Tax=Parvibium lacunae TaxID=1888893 RepID=A0A368KZJ5_9BURK|nr:hypothetical protein [Parvibium lacunae]RCS56738.1 hypothetical protein DU000_10325 [Parvibium lacunae]
MHAILNGNISSSIFILGAFSGLMLLSRRDKKRKDLYFLLSLPSAVIAMAHLLGVELNRCFLLCNFLLLLPLPGLSNSWIERMRWFFWVGCLLFFPNKQFFFNSGGDASYLVNGFIVGIILQIVFFLAKALKNVYSRKGCD